MFQCLFPHDYSMGEPQRILNPCVTECWINVVTVYVELNKIASNLEERNYRDGRDI